MVSHTSDTYKLPCTATQLTVALRDVYLTNRSSEVYETKFTVCAKRFVAENFVVCTVVIKSRTGLYFLTCNEKKYCKHPSVQ